MGDGIVCLAVRFVFAFTNLKFSTSSLCSVEFLYEIGVKRAAPVLPVGDRVQPHRFLISDDLPDAAVLQLAQRRRAEASLQGLLVSRAQLRNPQQAPDLVGAERRLRAHPHLAKASPMPVPAGVRYEGV